MNQSGAGIKVPKLHYQKTVLKVVNEEGAFQERFRQSEQEGMRDINGARILLESAIPNLEKRGKKLGIWWQMRGIAKQLRNIIKKIELTASPEQMATMALRLDQMVAHVGYNKVSRPPEGTYILTDDLAVMAECLMSDTCGLCSKKGAEAKNCPLQKALLSCTVEADGKEIDGCKFKAYSDAAYFKLIDEEDLAL